MFGLNGFDFAAMWSPEMIVFFGAIAGLYLYATGPGRFRFREAKPAFGSPFDLLGHLMFTFHMLSMAFAYIIAAPMLLAGTPEWLIRPIGRLPGVRSLKFLLNPVVTLILFNLAFSVYHMPVVHNYVMTNYVIHTLYYVVLMITALLMWFPIICPVKSMDRLAGFKKMGYIFANSVLLMPACALIIFSGSVLYATYTDPVLWAKAMGYCMPKSTTAILDMFSGPSSLQWMEPLEDQRLGGVLMKLIQEAVYGSILCYVFWQWYRRENPKGESDSLEPSPAVLERLRSAPEPVAGK
jgi:putative membrane protein